MTLEELFTEYMTYPAFASTALSNVNQIGDFGDAPLHLASRRGALEEMQILIDNGAEIEMRGEFQLTPLHGAVLMGKLEAVKLLLKYGADPFVKNGKDRTLFDIAQANQEREPSAEYSEIVRILEGYKAQLN